MPSDVVTRLAEKLIRAHAEGRRFESLRESLGSDRALSYRVQDAVVRELASSRRTRGAGYKIGLTSHAMQAMCGIDEPVAGRVLEDVVHESGVEITIRPGTHLGVEFEFAFLLGHNIDGASSIDEIAKAVTGVAPAFEIIDDRNADYSTLDANSLIADNSWNSAIVLGEFRPPCSDLAAVEGTARSLTGEVIGSGRGSDILGHLVEPLRWLSGHLAGRDRSLRAGDIVLSGSMLATVFPSPGDPYRFDLAAIGAVTVRFR